jgi:hypothetical protein
MEVEHPMFVGVILFQIAGGQNLTLWILIKFGAMQPCQIMDL